MKKMQEDAPGRERMKEKRKNIVKYILSFVLMLGILWFLQRLLMPKYAYGIVEGAFIEAYYKEEMKDYDVIFVGDCEVYENFSPVTLWQEYGINSYIRGSAEQYIWQSYYLLEDTFRYHKPEAVIFNVQALQFDEAQSEAYNRMTLEGMRWSKYKVKSILASMKEGESFIEYVFPILRYHSRWSELTADDLRYLQTDKKVSHNGYYMRVDVRPVESIPEPRILSSYEFGENAWEYLDRMRRLCEENGVALVLIKAPSLYPHWYEEWDVQVKEYAGTHGLRYINFLELQDETGIDYSTDTYDAGLHMNLSGAEKLSRYIGRILSKELQIPDRRGEEAWDAAWEEKAAFYESEKEAQYEQYGIDRP